MRRRPHPALGQRTRARLQSRWVGIASPFAQDERGVTSVVFGIMFTCILLGAAIAVDYSRATREKWDEQAAIDAAVIAAAADYAAKGDAASAEAVARSYFEANLASSSQATLQSFSIETERGEIRASSGSHMATTLMRNYGKDHMTVRAGAAAAFRKSSIEVALVLDNSAILSGSALTALKTASNKLNDILFTGADGSDLVKVGVVPFAGSVNVGAYRAAESWIDQGNFSTTSSSLHWENIGYDTESKVSRWTLFQRLGVSWAGCVEVRAGSHGTMDTAPNEEDPTSYFVPMFAPDEPDDVNTGNFLVTYPNSYIADYQTDESNSCPADEPVCARYNTKKARCDEWSQVTVSPPVKAQKRICKYEGQTPAEDKPGPNMNCNSTALTPLTNSKSTVTAALDAMTSNGNANIAEGVMWGLRVLSPGVPFTEGGAYGSVDKYMILLASGSNSIMVIDHDDLNKSEYTPWGYSVNGRLNPQSTQETALTNAMDRNSRTACREATNAGIKVYSIGFGVSDAHTRSMLQYCASTPHMNFEVDSESELLEVFESIGRELLQIRLSG